MPLRGHASKNRDIGQNKQSIPKESFDIFGMRSLSFSVHGGECYQLFYAIRLDLGIVRRSVSVDLAAFLAAIDYYIALSRIGNGRYRLHRTAALVGSVARIYIDVYRPKTKRTMIP